MSTIDQVIAGAQSADEVLAAAAPVLAAFAPDGTAVAGAITVSGEILAVIKAIVSWVEGAGLTKAANEAAVTAVEVAADVAERAKFGAVGG